MCFAAVAAHSGRARAAAPRANAAKDCGDLCVSLALVRQTVQTAHTHGTGLRPGVFTASRPAFFRFPGHVQKGESHTLVRVGGPRYCKIGAWRELVPVPFPLRVPLNRDGVSSDGRAFATESDKASWFEVGRWQPDVIANGVAHSAGPALPEPDSKFILAHPAPPRTHVLGAHPPAARHAWRPALGADVPDLSEVQDVDRKVREPRPRGPRHMPRGLVHRPRGPFARDLGSGPVGPEARNEHFCTDRVPY